MKQYSAGIFANIGTRIFTLPNDTQDWVLILESIGMPNLNQI